MANKFLLPLHFFFSIFQPVQGQASKKAIMHFEVTIKLRMTVNNLITRSHQQRHYIDRLVFIVHHTTMLYLTIPVLLNNIAL